MLADVENSGNRNVIKREAQQFLKYKDLTTTDIQRM
jgi:hypothetical protein